MQVIDFIKYKLNSFLVGFWHPLNVDIKATGLCVFTSSNLEAGFSARQLLWICPNFQLVKIKLQSQKVVPLLHNRLTTAPRPRRPHHPTKHGADLLEKVLLLFYQQWEIPVWVDGRRKTLATLPRKFIQLQSTPFRISFIGSNFSIPSILYRFFPLITTAIYPPQHPLTDDDLGSQWVSCGLSCSSAGQFVREE